MSAARIAARSKPVIVIKGGRHAEGARAAASHTGALAGADAVYDAVFARAGMLRVYSLEELFDAAETLSHYAAAGGEDAGEARLAMVTNGGGLGRSEEHTSELQSLMRISYAVFCLKQKNNTTIHIRH